MTDKKTDEEVLEYFILKMKKYGWVETKGEDLKNGVIKKNVDRTDLGMDSIYIDVEGDIYTYVRSSFAQESNYINLTSKELKLLAGYKSFIED